ncbi:Exonuclease domain-containing protein [Mycena indigotica]|uniref:RNA exonuclease 4 n=1 Tax=Mycena indigotica TaxID=2126181 RepID=A0A8H6W8C8_9AGAR|nr:Exonuclease domain-containing protein [Mycena indigotica]KAF7309539.1 Exonuclease domain-containing protein [Mycena indigotica]
MSTGKKSVSVPASSNWLALQKKLKPARKAESVDHQPRKRRKIEHSSSSSSLRPKSSSNQRPVSAIKSTEEAESESEEPKGSYDSKNSESLSALREMVFGHMGHTDAQRQPGKYLALDCEMVGVGPEGVESSLARVSIVNFFGAVLLDEFVKQRERVVDYRTEFSGVRETDMIHAKPFAEIQSRVAELIKDCILVGHAVHNDLKALLLTHPRPYTRDTQVYASKFKVSKSKYVALRHLVKQELGATIQGGEHSSVTDARATMAVFRLHRKQWEANSASWPPKNQSSGNSKGDDEEEVEPVSRIKKKNKAEKQFPGGGRKGISSGLSVITKKVGRREKGEHGSGSQWWKELGSNGSAKGSMRV